MPRNEDNHHQQDAANEVNHFRQDTASERRMTMDKLVDILRIVCFILLGVWLRLEWDKRRK